MIWGLSLHGWEDVMRASLAIVGVAGVIVGLATFFVVKLQREEIAASKDEFERYKISAKAESDNVTADAAKANERAATLEKQAAELKAANLALEAKVAPRRLSGDQKSKILSALSGAVPLPIAVVSRLMDAEGRDFAEDLASLFESLHWPVSRDGSWTQSDKGVFIAMVDPNPIQLSLISPLSAALKSASIEHEIIPIQPNNIGRIGEHFQPNVLYLLVGAKS